MDSYNPQTAPPEFGHVMRKFWSFDPEYVNLNNGSYGAPPRPVLEACRAITARIEENPDLFHRLEFQSLCENIRERIARLIGAQMDECVMVPNASHGINTVLRNFEWTEGDVLVVSNSTYNSISRTAQYISDRPPHPTFSQFTLTLPTSHARIIEQFRNHLRSLKQHLSPGPITHPTTTNKTVAVIDSISSTPGVHMPWQEMVHICREEGVWSVIDGAHSIGQELDINLAKANPDFWVSNCHKWLYAKRACAVLYVPKRNQHIIKSPIPTSYAYESPSSGKVHPFLQQFEWNGTIDYAPILSVDAALNFREYLGGEEKINAYCRKLAQDGGKRLTEIMGTEMMSSVSEVTGEDELTLNMVNVRLPLPSYINSAHYIEPFCTTKLLTEHKISVLIYYHGGHWWTRASAQVWNEIADFEMLGKALIEVCADVVKTNGGTFDMCKL